MRELRGMKCIKEESESSSFDTKSSGANNSITKSNKNAGDSQDSQDANLSQFKALLDQTVSMKRDMSFL